MDRKIRVCVGTGGVGKTTVSVAIAYREALRGQKVLVLTIDPARRLRSFLVLDPKGGEQRIDIDVPGEFWAAVLDVEHTLRKAVLQYGEHDQARHVLRHPIYKMLVSSLAGMQELMAIECLDQAFKQGFETMVVDTAPSRHAFEFLDKPEFFAELVSFPLVKIVGRSYRFWADSPLGRLGRRSFDIYGRLEELVGARVVSQVLDFYSVFRSIAEGYAERARSTSKLLRDRSVCRFSVVTVPGKATQDAKFFFSELRGRGFSVDRLIVNRFWPDYAVGKQSRSPILEWYRQKMEEQEKTWATLHSEYAAKGLRLCKLPELAKPVGSFEAVGELCQHLDD